MVARGVGGVLVRLVGHMGLVYGKILEKVGGSSLDILYLRWVTTSRLDFDMMCGVVWCGGQTIKLAFPELFSIARFRDAFVAYHLQVSSDSYQWNINFIRAAQDWEVDLCTAFFNML
jgi:hypothetical protein